MTKRQIAGLLLHSVAMNQAVQNRVFLCTLLPIETLELKMNSIAIDPSFLQHCLLDTADPLSLVWTDDHRCGLLGSFHQQTNVLAVLSGDGQLGEMAVVDKLSGNALGLQGRLRIRLLSSPVRGCQSPLGTLAFCSEGPQIGFKAVPASASEFLAFNLKSGAVVDAKKFSTSTCFETWELDMLHGESTSTLLSGDSLRESAKA